MNHEHCVRPGVKEGKTRPKSAPPHEFVRLDAQP
jgi:hypothetical protein